jgi:ribosomal protein L37E
MTGEEWVHDYCRQRNLIWKSLSPTDQNAIARLIPCNVRCWRVGVAADTVPGEPCPECGWPVPKQATYWKLLENPRV